MTIFYLLSPFFSFSFFRGINATIRKCLEIQCLPYAEFVSSIYFDIYIYIYFFEIPQNFLKLYFCFSILIYICAGQKDSLYTVLKSREYTLTVTDGQTKNLVSNKVCRNNHNNLVIYLRSDI